MRYDVAIIGAGPAGLASAREAAKLGAKVIVVERFTQPGGLSRTVKNGSCRFDIGPHRFFTKNQEVNTLFKETLGADAVSVNRLTRILFKNTLFNYPLNALNTLKGVGMVDAAGILGSYGLQKLHNMMNGHPAANFEEWVTREFGPKLFGMFFKSYTEKVWGIPCTEIAAEWASQRIKGMNLLAVIQNALSRPGSTKVKSLVDKFDYPRQGAGMFYEIMARQLTEQGVAFRYGAKAVALKHEGGQIRSLVVETTDGTEEIEARMFISSSPLTHVAQMMSPDMPVEVATACSKLRYREHVGVQLTVEGETFPDNWIYVHAGEVKMARVANYSNFSKEMGSGDIKPITVEYFCFKNDPLWKLSDGELVALGKKELCATGLMTEGQFTGGFVIRSENAYPVIEQGHADPLMIVRKYLAGFSNHRSAGRSGMFKYNNQDHAIATGLLAARNLMGVSDQDPWNVNIDGEYHEEIREGELKSAA